MRVLYYDCFSGISGDMNLGALVDIGVPSDYITDELHKLGLHGAHLLFKKDSRKGITGTKAEVVLDQLHEDRHHHHHEHRTFADIREIIGGSSLSESVKKTALYIFSLIAEAEAKIHDKPVAEVHFHEVGALDSIVDIVGGALALDYLKPDIILSSAVEVGSGTVECAHGRYPVPAPATSEILKDIPLRLGGTPNEATTPTGAAILKATVQRFGDVLDFTIKSVGYGIGHRDNPSPNVLRVFLGETSEGFQDTTLSKDYVIECNLDDMNPECYETILEKCLEIGANDVTLTPIAMKKNRPAQMLSVLVKEEKKGALIELLFRETTTFGLRITSVDKLELKRDSVTVETLYGTLRTKRAFLNGQIIKRKAEYEDCKRIAHEHKLPIIEVYRQINAHLSEEDS